MNRLATPKQQFFRPDNRKYIGAKSRLLDVIVREITQRVGQFTTLIDLFAGTGIVAYTFACQGKTVIANDHLAANFVGLLTFLTPPTRAESEHIEQLLAELNALPPATQGYCVANYGGTYFTPTNAGRIDAIREQIASWQAEGKLTPWLEAALLTSLVYAVDKVANTCGQYDAFLKHLGQEAYSPEGRHLVDATVYKELVLYPPVQLPQGQNNQVYQADANSLIAKLRGEVLYLDPPYNARQYFQNYHVLENIVTWRKPLLHGKTRKYRDSTKKSLYSSKGQVAAALRALLQKTRIPHVFLSYNSEGLLSHQEIMTILGEVGTPAVCETDYAVFGNGAGRAEKRQVKERLYYCRIQ